MTYIMKPTIKMGKVVLNVRDLWTMLTFYQNKVGLDVLESSSEHALLGIREDNKELLELRISDKEISQNPRTGLFHVAFLVPTRRDLANILFSLITQKDIDVQGASDHGYSEALYFTDPEGNGIEIYRDKPKEEWTINEDGTIPGITKPMDGNAVLAEKDKEVEDKMPHGTVIGHVHLMVSNIDETKEFYTNVLGMDVKYEAGTSAIFMAAGEYHHHLAMNIWSTSDAPSIQKDDIGLNHYTIIMPDQAEYDALKANVTEQHTIVDETDTSFKLYDPNGICVKITSV